MSNAVWTSGTYAGDIPIANTSGQFNAAITGWMTFNAAGVYGFSVYVNCAFVIGVEWRHHFASGTQNLGALAGGTAQISLPGDRGPEQCRRLAWWQLGAGQLCNQRSRRRDLPV